MLHLEGVLHELVEMLADDSADPLIGSGLQPKLAGARRATLGNVGHWRHAECCVLLNERLDPNDRVDRQGKITMHHAGVRRHLAVGGP